MTLPFLPPDITQTFTAFAETVYCLIANLPIYMVPGLYKSIHFERHRASEDNGSGFTGRDSFGEDLARSALRGGSPAL